MWPSKCLNLGRKSGAWGLDWRHLPIADYSVPGEAFEKQWKTHGRDIRALLRGGADVIVHCKGGLGRAGMIAARLLVELGMPPSEQLRMCGTRAMARSRRRRSWR